MTKFHGMITQPNGTLVWYQDGYIHRDDGPAVQRPDGTVEWYRNNAAHRDGGPAVIKKNGAWIWYRNGKLHREDGPAVEISEECWEFWQDGVLHRVGGPAINENGTLKWFRNGKLHREDGPAVIRRHGKEEWYQNGKLHREDGPAEWDTWYWKGQKIGVLMTVERFREEVAVIEVMKALNPDAARRGKRRFHSMKVKNHFNLHPLEDEDRKKEILEKFNGWDVRVGFALDDLDDAKESGLPTQVVPNSSRHKQSHEIREAGVVMWDRDLVHEPMEQFYEEGVVFIESVNNLDGGTTHWSVLVPFPVEDSIRRLEEVVRAASRKSTLIECQKAAKSALNYYSLDEVIEAVREAAVEKTQEV